MTAIQIETQAQLDAALADGNRAFEIVAKGNFEISLPYEVVHVSVSEKLAQSVLIMALGSSRVVARDSSRVVALGSSHVVARNQATIQEK